MPQPLVSRHLKVLRERGMVNGERRGTVVVYSLANTKIIEALDLLGYSRDHPDFVEAETQFNRLLFDDGERFFFQPCFSTVWDTAIAMVSLDSLLNRLATKS